MILNVARADYLTLTTFHQAKLIQDALADLYPDEFARPAKQGSYTGLQWSGLFAGKGKQNGVPHYIIRSHGEDAETVFWRTNEIAAKCTRVDLQITIRLPEFYSSRNLFDKLIAKDTKWTGRRMKPRIIQSGDDLDTVYIGSRTSDRLFRIYVKPGEDKQPEYIRFEVEYKRKLAQKVRNLIVSRETIPRAILAADLHRLPVYVSRILERFDDGLSGERYTIKPEKAWSDGSTIQWIENQIEPAINRLLLSHQDGPKMRTLLYRWAKYAYDLNRYTDMEFNPGEIEGGKGEGDDN
jgi:hypothetical protein